MHNLFSQIHSFISQSFSKTCTLKPVLKSLSFQAPKTVLSPSKPRPKRIKMSPFLLKIVSCKQSDDRNWMFGWAVPLRLVNKTQATVQRPSYLFDGVLCIDGFRQRCLWGKKWRENECTDKNRHYRQQRPIVHRQASVTTCKNQVSKYYGDYSINLSLAKCHSVRVQRQKY